MYINSWTRKLAGALGWWFGPQFSSNRILQSTGDKWVAESSLDSSAMNLTSKRYASVLRLRKKKKNNYDETAI